MQDPMAKDLSMREFGLKIRHQKRNLDLNEQQHTEPAHKKKKSLVQGIKGFIYKKIKKNKSSRASSEENNYDEFIPFTKSPI